MRFGPVFVLCVLGATVLVAGSDTYGDEGGEQVPPIDEKGMPEYPNLDSQLRSLLEEFEAGAYSGYDAAGTSKDPADPLPPLGLLDPADPLPSGGPKDPPDGLPPVDVTLYVIGDIKAVARFLTSNGASVRNIGSTYLEASVPVALLGEVSQQPGVIRVEPIIGLHSEDNLYSSLPPEAKGNGGAPEGSWNDVPLTSGKGLGVEAGGSKEDAPQIPGKATQQFANLTSDLDGIAKEVNDGVFSADSLAERALLYEQPAEGADRTSGAEGQSGDDETSVGVTIYALEDIGAATGFLKRNGVTIRHQGETYLEAYVPVSLLGQASMQPDVIRIEPIIGPWVDQAADPCIVDLGTLTPPAEISRSGSWTGGCASENRIGRFARYYTFTLAQNAALTINLTSSDADTYLNLMKGVGRDGDVIAWDDHGGAGINSRIAQSFHPGQYTIEATTHPRGDTGSFNLAIDASPLNICVESLGDLSGGAQRVTRTGTHARGCDSTNRIGSYARYYSFTLKSPMVMRLYLDYYVESQTFYLIRGEGTEAVIDHYTIAMLNDRPNEISAALRAGAYTIQVATVWPGDTETRDPGPRGNFKLTINAWPQNTCIESLGEISGTQTVSRTGTLTGGCSSVNRAASHVQYYRFTLPQDTLVTVDLTSGGIRPHLSLIQGARTDGEIIASDKGFYNARIARRLQPGQYMLEVTTSISRYVDVGFALEINTLRQNACVESLGEVNPRGDSEARTAVRTGTWASGCDSINRFGHYAQYYSFTLTHDANVFVRISSTSKVIPYLYLIQGAGTDGKIIASDNSVSPIRISLPAGAYTVQATTDALRSTGKFRLLIISDPLSVCLEDAGEVSSTRTVDLEGSWSEGCPSGRGVGNYARYYRFTLLESAFVNFRLHFLDRSSPTPLIYYDKSSLMYIIDGPSWFDDVISTNFHSYNTLDTAVTAYFGQLKAGVYLAMLPGPNKVMRRPDDRFRLEIMASPVSPSEGALVHGAPPWNGAGVTGRDIRVGVIDAGFSGYTRIRSTMPRVAGARCYTLSKVTDDPDDCGGTVHGTAVAEAVVDVAPDVSLYIANPDTPGELRDAVDWMISEGVEVINHSVSWRFDGPGDGTSPRENSPLRSVDRAVASGITWVNAAGKHGRSAWLGEYSDVDGDGYIEFHGNDERNTAQKDTDDVSPLTLFQLRWDDSWTGADTDLDIYVLDSQGRTVANSLDFQTGMVGHVPYEVASMYSLGEFQVVVTHVSGDAPRWIQLVVWGAELEHHTQGSITSPAESANPGLLAVGAAPWSDVETIESFSSQGPTPDGRIKPDIVGADGARSITYRTNFYGTSQSSPHVAGMAAIVRQWFPDYGPADVARYLKNQALPRPEIEGGRLESPNNVWGYGFAHLPPPPMISMARSLTSPDPDSGDQFGVSSATSADGSTLVIGSLGDGNAGEQSGAAYVFTKSMDRWVETAKLTASDGAAFDRFGSSVSMSGDGSAIAVGAPGDGSGPGSVYVFARPAGGWATSSGASKLTASDGAAGDGFGSSVSMSGDGSAIVVGAHSNDSVVEDAGAAYVFARPASGWVTAAGVVKLTASDGAAYDEFGSSVSASQDGGTIAVGARGDSPGSVYVFTMPSGGWVATSTTIKLTGPSDVDARAQIGGSVSVSGDGGTIVAGSPEAPGAAYVFTIPSEGWVTTSDSTRINAPDGDARDQFGWSVSTNSDGSTIAVGAPGSDLDAENAGVVYVFTMPTDGWMATTTVAKLRKSLQSPGGNFGHSVSVSADGSTVTATMPNWASTGAAHVFTLTAAGWEDTTSAPRLSSMDIDSGNSFGWSVSASADESVIAVGAHGDDANGRDAGAAYVFTSPSKGWGAETPPARIKLTAPDGAVGDEFGRAVSVSGDGSTIAVGAHGDDDNGVDSGSVYVFTSPSSGWTAKPTPFKIKLTAPDGAVGDEFGRAVSVSGDGSTIAVGAHGDDDNGVDSGSVYVFTRPSDGWIVGPTSVKLTASNGAADDLFGWSVSVSGDGSTIAVGAHGDDGNKNDAGSAYVFMRPGGGWTAKAKLAASARLTASDAESDDAFGWSVSVSGDGSTIAVGAHGDDGNKNDAGSAYVFTRPGPGWTATSEAAKLTTFVGDESDAFGGSVSVNADGDRVVVGASGDDNDASNSGAVYLFMKPSGGWVATHPTARLPSERASGMSTNRFLGSSVSIGGNVIAAGAYSGSERVGETYVYRLFTPPEVGTIPDMTMPLGGSPVMVDVSSNFRDPDGGTLVYTVKSRNRGIATAAVSSTGVVTITPTNWQGDVRILVTATNPYRLSATQSFTVTITGPPARIRDLTVIGSKRSSISLSWTPPNDNGGEITRYELQRKTKRGHYKGDYEAVTPGPTLTSTSKSKSSTMTYRDSEPSSGNTYTYRVRAHNAAGAGRWSNEVNAQLLTRSPDKDALVALYDATDGDNWRRNTNWKSDLRVDEWYGVTTDEELRVTELRLPRNNLQGMIPSELGKLGNLQRLYLHNNRLTGDTHNNRLTGEIPSELGNLGNLQRLYLYNNELTGEIPSELGNLGNLQWLYLYNNRLTGEIPSELGKLGNLQRLYLVNNRLTGEMPSELGNLDNLRYLRLNNNRLTGEIPERLTRLTKLREFFFVDSGLCAPRDAAFQAWLTGVQNVDVRDHTCAPTPTPPPATATPTPPSGTPIPTPPSATPIPTPPPGTPISTPPSATPIPTPPPATATPTPTPPPATATPTPTPPPATATPTPTPPSAVSSTDKNALIALYDSTDGDDWRRNGNWKSDRPLNEWYGVTTNRAGRVTRLRLPQNNLQGTLPSELGNLDHLQWLYLHNNGQTGRYNNRLTGDIPSELGKLDFLQRLYLYNNELTGEIPSELGDIDDLQDLSLYGNKLTGEIPSELGDLDKLAGLFLHGNRLTGEMPSELGNLDNLNALYIYRNRLTGEIPDLTRLSRLQYFHFVDSGLCAPRDAEFQTWLNGVRWRSGPTCPPPPPGTPTATATPLSGSPSRDRDALIALYDSTDGDDWRRNGGWKSDQPLNEWHGVSANDEGRVVKLDLYRNNLRGMIPSELGNLDNLHWLLLHNNKLTGEIPSELGNLDNLHWLFLHINKLTGEIPSELGKLDNLEGLYLYNNELTGEIPSELGNLDNLQGLYLYNNELTGEIPSELGNLDNLRYLILNSNTLTGEMPERLTRLTRLRQFYFEDSGLCAPRDAPFQAWLGGLRLYSGPTCAPPGTPPATATPTPTPPAATATSTPPTVTATPTPTPPATATPTPPTATATPTPPTATAIPTPLPATAIPTPPNVADPPPTGGGFGGGSFGGGGGGGSFGGGSSGGVPPAQVPTPTPIPSQIILSTDTLAFTAVQGGDTPTAQTISMWNAIRETDMQFTVSSNTDWLSFSPTSSSSNGPQLRVQVRVSADASGLKAGTYSGTIVVSASGASNTPQSISITLSVTAPPVRVPVTTDAVTEIATSDSAVRLVVPAGAAPADVEIRVTKLDAGSVGSQPGAQERVALVAELETFAAGSNTPTPMTYPRGVDLRFALPEGAESSCAAGRVRVYWVNDGEWTLLEHRCETDAAGAVWAVSTLTHFSTYVMSIEDAPATPTPAVRTASPTPTAVPTPTTTSMPTATPTAVPPSTRTSTPIPTATRTPVPAATHTPIPTVTHTPIPTATHTSIPTATHTPIPTATHTPMPTATHTPVPVATHTPMPTATRTPIPTATHTLMPTATHTPTATYTPVSLAAVQPGATAFPTPAAATQSEDQGGGANVIAGIAVVLLVIGAGAAAVIYLMRRRGTAISR